MIKVHLRNCARLRLLSALGPVDVLAPAAPGAAGPVLEAGLHQAAGEPFPDSYIPAELKVVGPRLWTRTGIRGWVLVLVQASSRSGGDCRFPSLLHQRSSPRRTGFSPGLLLTFDPGGGGTQAGNEGLRSWSGFNRDRMSQQNPGYIPNTQQSPGGGTHTHTHPCLPREQG